MSTSSLKQCLNTARIAALKTKDKKRLAVIQLILSAIKQREVDERIELDDDQIITTLSKMVKQRRDSLAQYKTAHRADLAEQEQFEIDIISEYLPQAFSTEEVENLIQTAIQDTQATTMQDMGSVMGYLKPKLQGRADMSLVSQQIRKILSSQ